MTEPDIRALFQDMKASRRAEDSPYRKAMDRKLVSYFREDYACPIGLFPEDPNGYPYKPMKPWITKGGEAMDTDVIVRKTLEGAAAAGCEKDIGQVHAAMASPVMTQKMCLSLLKRIDVMLAERTRKLAAAVGRALRPDEPPARLYQFMLEWRHMALSIEGHSLRLVPNKAAVADYRSGGASMCTDLELCSTEVGVVWHF